MFVSAVVLGVIFYFTFGVSYALADPGTISVISAISQAIGVISGVKGLFAKPPKQQGFPQAAPPPIPEKTRPDVGAAGLGAIGTDAPTIGFGGLSPLQEASNIFTAGVGGGGQIDPQFSKDPFGLAASQRAHNALIQTLESGSSPDDPALGIGAQYAKKAGFPLQGQPTTRSLVSSLQELIARG